MKTFTGDRTIDGITVLVDGRPLPPRHDLLRLTEHGFEWSYEGPEPSQLAFALLFEHLGDAEAAKALHRPFMEQVVANFDNAWELTGADIDAAIAALRDRHTA